MTEPNSEHTDGHVLGTDALAAPSDGGDGGGLTDEQQAVVRAFVQTYGAEALTTALTAGALFKNLRAESRWALETAVSAGTTRGINGYLVIRLPRMPNDLTEMSFLTGGAHLNLGFA